MKYDNFNAVDNGFANVSGNSTPSTNATNGTYVNIGSFDSIAISNTGNPNDYYFLGLQAWATPTNGNYPPYVPNSPQAIGRNIGLTLIKNSVRPALVSWIANPSVVSNTNYQRILANANNQLRPYNMRIATQIGGM